MRKAGHTTLKPSLEAAIAAYNETPQTTTGIKPNDAHKPEFRNAVNKVLEKKRGKTIDKYAPEIERINQQTVVGDLVRIRLDKLPFEKEATESWSIKLYRVSKVAQSSPLLSYRLVDTVTGSELPGTFTYLDIKKP